MSMPTSTEHLKIIPSCERSLILLSTTDFSSLNSGIPNLNNPPGFSLFSKTVISCPALFNCCAAARPAGPEPIIAIFLPVLIFGGSGFTRPDSQAFSIIFFSIISMETGSLFIERVQEASQGAGHILPVNSGKLLVADNLKYADSQSSL